MTGHTPTPWRIDYLDKNNQRVVRGEHIEICTCWHHSVGTIEKEMEANAAFIVRAVNSHDDLVAALDAVLNHSNDMLACAANVAKARAALAKARGET